ncbi:YqiA/YcfP family alpha/beta fold hydrolase [Leptothermofonsia sp. ETS-13]|uniref:YqiA/YcfP family alpha/beta fold hydrolase n=1 Tax=Leptothermofonsia sp. ETS-13 TaxID=3035696 RepID=UPI003BA0E821
MHYIYLHGFASSPHSAKARDLGDRFAQLNIPLLIPDLNQQDFTHLTLTRQLQQVESLLPNNEIPVTLIGSSFGGLTAAWLGQKHPQVQRLVLLAPAFGFLSHWLPKLGQAQVQQWQKTGFLSVYHYGEDRMLPLSYQFVEDAAQYQEDQLQRPVPTLILHGRHDEVIPIEASIHYAQTRPWVTLVELNSNHALTDVRDEIWEVIQRFCLRDVSTP